MIKQAKKTAQENYKFWAVINAGLMTYTEASDAHPTDILEAYEWALLNDQATRKEMNKGQKNKRGRK